MEQKLECTASSVRQRDPYISGPRISTMYPISAGWDQLPEDMPIPPEYWSPEEEEAAKARDSAGKAFSGATDVTGDAIPSDTLDASELAEGVGLIELVVRAGFEPSNGKARKLIQGGGVQGDAKKRSLGLSRCAALRTAASALRMTRLLAIPSNQSSPRASR